MRTSKFLQSSYKTQYIYKIRYFTQSFKTRPGPRLGFRVLARSPGLTGSAGSILLKKNQNDVVLVKKKQKKTKANGFVTGSWPGLARSAGSPGRPAGSHRVFPSPVFSSTRPGSGPGSTRRAGPGFKTIISPLKFLNFNIYPPH
jgi:hypothetical protein